jgi:hypothetical protein
MTDRIIYNSDWAKRNIAMPDLLSAFGHDPVHITKSGSEYWYVSPFRYEKEPSFHTSYLGGKWIWNDFGRGDVQGSGTVIGFLEMHENVNVSGALKILKELFPNKGIPVSTESLKRMPLFKDVSFRIPQKPRAAPEEKLVVKEVKQEVWDKGLIGYLAGERKIDHRLALPYLKHIIYEHVDTGKQYNTLGFENESGDYECRDKFFKGILKNPDAKDRAAAKDITYIPGKEKGRVAVFEGFMDFLTVLTIKKQPVLPVDVVVLNMVNMRRRAIDFIKRAGYDEIYTFFDNDPSGEKTTELFLSEPGLEAKVKPQNHLYTGFKDYNAFLLNR